MAERTPGAGSGDGRRYALNEPEAGESNRAVKDSSPDSGRALEPHPDLT